jgi:hypothetical protein
MSVEIALAVESISKQPRHEPFIFGKGDHAVSNVAGRHDVQFFPQSSGAAAVVCDSHDNGKVGRAVLQASKKSRQSGAASNGENSGAR